MRKAFLLSIALAWPLTAHARDPSSIPIAQCDFSEVVSFHRMESIERAGIAATQAKPVLQKLDAIVSRAKKPGVPIREQLPQNDLDEFSRLSQQSAASMLAQLIESHRERDLKVLAQLIRLADQEYRWGKTPSEQTDEDFMPYLFLTLMRQQLGSPRITSPEQSRCSMEYALYKIQEPVLELFNQIRDFNRGVTFLNEMRKKYKQETIDPGTMTKVDAEAVRRWQDILRPGFRHIAFVTDVEHIKLMASAADLNAQSKAQDLTFVGGDITKIGATLDYRIEKGEVDAETQKALKIWFVVNEKIPSDMSKMLGGVTGATK